uniref:Olfactory receptor n=1 Tax=Naja naja TaxID=35670 RepID=A0A8C7DW35_NAJNA
SQKYTQTNITMNITEFIVLGFGNIGQWQSLLFFVFLVVYIVAMAGNILIVTLVAGDQNLHTTMYFFLGNLSCLETCHISNIVPKMMAGLLTDKNTISFTSCFVQFFFFSYLMATECYLLSAMSYDRYLAICKPLHYTTSMTTRICIQLAASSWISSLIAGFILLSVMLQLTFCGPNEIDHYFCDTYPIMKLSCSDTTELVDFILALMVIIVPLCMVITSYIYIISTVLKIPSAQGRKKAFSTCSSHLTVVVLFYSTTLFTYARPKAMYAYNSNKLVSVLYTVIVPLLNPLIYCLRNKEINSNIWKSSLSS